MPTQEQRSDATSTRLLAQARALFGRDGYAQTWTGQIVEAAEVTRGALYHHFGDKRGLFAAVYEHEEELLAAALVRAAAPAADPGQRVRLGCQAYLRACLSPAFQRIYLIDGPAVLGAEHVRAVTSAHSHALLRQALRAASDAGTPPEAIDARAGLVMGALCEAGVFVARADDPEGALETVAEQTDFLLDGVLSRGHPTDL